MASSDVRKQIVVQGEASETDSDEEVYLTSLPPARGLRVPGEASETDSEEEEEEEESERPRGHGEEGPVDPVDLVSSVGSGGPVSPVDPVHGLVRAPRGGQNDTLLQQKLLESNARLRDDVTRTIRQVYLSASREVRAATSHLSSAQNGIISASHSVRLVLDDLRSVSEKMDIITSCNLLPDISAPPAL